MDSGSFNTDVFVDCNCGAHIHVADPGMTDDITCTSCGCKVHLHKRANGGLEWHAPSALLDILKKKPDQGRHRAAVEFVREQKYVDAMDLYQTLLEATPYRRDAYYGMGYCYYKLGRHRESRDYLETAGQLGHPAAVKLLPKLLVPKANAEGPTRESPA